MISMLQVCYMPVTPTPYHEQVALDLIKAGADLEKQLNSGHTALMLACQNGHSEVCAHVRCPLQLYVLSCL